MRQVRLSNSLTFDFNYRMYFFIYWSYGGIKAPFLMGAGLLGIVFFIGVGGGGVTILFYSSY